MRKIISLIMVLFLTFGAIGCFFQLKKYSSGGTSIGKEESVESSSSGTGTSSESTTPQIKTLGSLAIGSKVKVSHSVMGDIEFLIADKDHDGYPENSTTLITEKIILLRAFDAIEPDNKQYGCQSGGNNKYSFSNIDQWLNSSGAAGQWFSKQHSDDRKPDSIAVSGNPYDQDAGFLSGFSDAFLIALKETTIKVVLNTIVYGGGYESITRKFFLPSCAELFGIAENEIMEGSILSYFSENTDEIRRASLSAYAAEDNTNKGSKEVAAGVMRWYWLRTPLYNHESNVRYVFLDGKLSYGNAFNGDCGVRPLCNLSSDTKVSESPDENGYYSLVFN